MNLKFFLFLATLFSFFNLPAQTCNNGELGWAEVGVIFSSNGCTSCHGMVSNFNLTSYQTFVQGGVKCGSNITMGTTLADIITTDAYAGCRTALTGQSMNDRVMGMVDALELLKIQRWITGGAPEFCYEFCIEDEMISTTLNNAIYHFNVDANLTANNIIENGSDINYEAGDTITLNIEFEVKVGSEFYAFIGDCKF